MPTQDAASEMAKRMKEGMKRSDAARRFAAQAYMAKAFEVDHRFRRELASTLRTPQPIRFPSLEALEPILATA